MIEITTDLKGRFNLNALHKASGLGEEKAPNRWLRAKQTQELIAELEHDLMGSELTPNMALAQELIEELSVNSHLGQKVLKIQKGGVTPGTFAHELLAVSYAGWISPAFQLQVNQTFYSAQFCAC
ncbi:TPA: KilA-N domain-containing protein [Yersinia enterocolitica]